jgi:Uma2 family endonuclease
MSTAMPVHERAAGLYTVDNLPESDGKPMGETPKHVMLIVDALNALQHYFRDNPLMYIIGDVFVYFLNELGTLRRVAPDIFVVPGVSKEERRVYAVEKEGKAPEFVIEFTSKRTKKMDWVKKREIYAWLGVNEYFLFDPFGEYLKPRLIGFELVGGEYVQMNPKPSRLPSKVLGLDLAAEGTYLRFYDHRTGERIPTYAEIDLARRIAEEKAQREAAARHQELVARQAVEAENARLRAEVERLRQGKS